DAKVKLELAPDTGDKQADQLLSEARETLVAIHAANDRIEDPNVSRCVDGIETSCIAILSRLEELPALHGQLRTFLRYYLPTTRKILDARASLEEGGMRVESELRVAARADRVLPEIQRAFERQLEAIDKHRFLDLQVEMDVLEGMLKSDGLIDASRKI
ncbi:MAG: 5-bromo-4-chloroindolyl phosphate hydrolysis family protein, partial [Clostridia bacterium]|nr:5-bromo-4-chloroindolyl phosphate hydrolysis family protein [Clostridia bacterium]